MSERRFSRLVGLGWPATAGATGLGPPRGDRRGSRVVRVVRPARAGRRAPALHLCRDAAAGRIVGSGGRGDAGARADRQAGRARERRGPARRGPGRRRGRHAARARRGRLRRARVPLALHGPLRARPRRAGVVLPPDGLRTKGRRLDDRQGVHLLAPPGAHGRRDVLTCASDRPRRPALRDGAPPGGRGLRLPGERAWGRRASRRSDESGEGSSTCRTRGSTWCFSARPSRWATPPRSNSSGRARSASRASSGASRSTRRCSSSR